MELVWALENLTPNAILDILLVALVFFGASFFLRGTQAVALLRGMLIVLVSMMLISSVLNLLALGWLLQNLLTILAIAIPVIFQPELRRALEQLGRAGGLMKRAPTENVRAQIIEDVCQAAERLSERRHGALIVLARNSSLEDFIRTGIVLNSDVSPQLLLTIFWPKTELHDGAAIIDIQGRLASAASVLPLTASRNLPDRKLGTRHRAASGAPTRPRRARPMRSPDTARGGRRPSAHRGVVPLRAPTTRGASRRPPPQRSPDRTCDRRRRARRTLRVVSPRAGTA